MISEFRGDNRWLSNFHAAVILADEKIYPTTEHFYQSKRALTIEDELAVISQETPFKAMHFGRDLTNQRPFEEWAKLRLGIMRRASLLKYTQHLDLARCLVATGDEELVEGNSWNDIFWGQCPIGTGENWLGRILMETREIVKGII